MQSLAAKTAAVGLPSLLPTQSSKGPKRGKTASPGPRLGRTWTLRSRPGPGSSSTATAALPFPFMEISVSVLENLDVLRSSVEEEVVFQATLNVPAHHALACRIEAYDSPFAQAPALSDAPEVLSEQDRQFAACLASPPDVDEVHQVNLRTADNTNMSFVQRSAPSVRFASGVLTLSLSLKQRSSDLKKENTGGQDDDFELSDLDQVMRVPSAARHTGTQAHPDSLRHHSSFTQTAAGSSGAGEAAGAAGAAAGGHKQSRPVPACVSIPEEGQDAGPNASTAAAAPAAAAAAAAPVAAQTQSSLEQQRPARPTGFLRVQSFTAQGRHVSEVPLTTQLAKKGVATLLGVGYMMLYALEARMQPHTQFWQHEVQVDSFAGKPPAADTEWVSAPVHVHSWV